MQDPIQVGVPELHQRRRELDDPWRLLEPFLEDFEHREKELEEGLLQGDRRVVLLE